MGSPPTGEGPDGPDTSRADAEQMVRGPCADVEQMVAERLGDLMRQLAFLQEEMLLENRRLRSLRGPPVLENGTGPGPSPGLLMAGLPRPTARPMAPAEIHTFEGSQGPAPPGPYPGQKESLRQGTSATLQPQEPLDVLLDMEPKAQGEEPTEKKKLSPSPSKESSSLEYDNLDLGEAADRNQPNANLLSASESADSSRPSPLSPVTSSLGSKREAMWSPTVYTPVPSVAQALVLGEACDPCRQEPLPKGLSMQPSSSSASRTGPTRAESRRSRRVQEVAAKSRRRPKPKKMASILDILPGWETKEDRLRQQLHGETMRAMKTLQAGKYATQESIDEEEIGLELQESLSVLGGVLSKARLSIHKLLNRKGFDTTMALVIIMNSIIIGQEIDAKRRGEDGFDLFFGVLENIFVLIYMAEIAMRFFAHGTACLNSGWVRFDLTLVVLGILGSWLLPPVLSLADDATRNQVNGSLNPVLVIRIFRLFRLARALRLLVQFRTLWMLVQGLIHSSSTILFTVGLIVMLLYIFSCIGVEVITIPHMNEDGEMGEIVRQHWESIPGCMLTLIRFVTLDSIGGIYEPMIRNRGELLFFFMPFLLIVSVALMNLVTAVIVEGALEQAKLDKEAQSQYKKIYLQQLLPVLRDVFQTLDNDASGSLSLDEIVLAREHEKIASELDNCLGSVTFEELFDIIDEDGSGEVTIEEFCDGVAKMSLTDSPVELFVIMKQLAQMKLQLEELQSKAAPAAPARDPLRTDFSYGRLSDSSTPRPGQDRGRTNTLESLPELAPSILD